jgi:hypothetical protein
VEHHLVHGWTSACAADDPWNALRREELRRLFHPIKAGVKRVGSNPEGAVRHGVPALHSVGCAETRIGTNLLRWFNTGNGTEVVLKCTPDAGSALPGRASVAEPATAAAEFKVGVSVLPRDAAVRAACSCSALEQTSSFVQQNCNTDQSQMDEDERPSLARVTGEVPRMVYVFTSRLRRAYISAET